MEEGGGEGRKRVKTKVCEIDVTGGKVVSQKSQNQSRVLDLNQVEYITSFEWIDYFCHLDPSSQQNYFDPVSGTLARYSYTRITKRFIHKPCPFALRISLCTPADMSQSP
jgi:hypothetical protein